jgi:hypothetical protein
MGKPVYKFPFPLPQSETRKTCRFGRFFCSVNALLVKDFNQTSCLGKSDVQPSILE